jgi:hypothetical protein
VPLVQQEASLAAVRQVLLNVILGATVIRELIGPLRANLAIVNAGDTASS